MKGKLPLKKVVRFTILLIATTASVDAMPCNIAIPDSIPLPGNPIIKDKYTADPAALVYNGTVYLYTGHDEAPPKKNGYEMYDWLCYSSTDMVK